MVNQMIPQQAGNCNALINITYGDRPTVSARELHKFLEVGTPYKDWFPRMTEYGFTDGTDFSAILSESTGGRPSTDHQLTLDMAKEISMIQRTEKGKQARQYFIAVEKQVTQAPAALSPLEIMRSMIDAQIQSEKRMSKVETSVARLETKMQTALERPVIIDWCKFTNAQINMIVEARLLNHQAYRGDLYSELEQTARCNLDARQTQLRRRMRESGHTVKECKAVSKLHIIDADPKLRAIFDGIVRRESARCG